MVDGVQSTVLVINIVAPDSHATSWMRRDNVLTDTLLSNPKLSFLIFMADTCGLRLTSRCTTLRAHREVLRVFSHGFFLAGILLPPSSAIQFMCHCQPTPVWSEIARVECPALWRAEMAARSGSAPLSGKTAKQQSTYRISRVIRRTFFS